MENKELPGKGIGRLSTDRNSAKSPSRNDTTEHKELRVVTCSCGGKIPWDIIEKRDGFCPYCGIFLHIMD